MTRSQKIDFINSLFVSPRPKLPCLTLESIASLFYECDSMTLGDFVDDFFEELHSRMLFQEEVFDETYIQLKLF